MRDISDEEVRALTTAIKSRYDLDFTCYEMGSLKRRVSRALSIFSLDSTHELWVKVLREQGFIHKLVNELSVGLTSMFRDPKLWRRLKTLIPELLKEKEKLRVWHAGCSTGEEVFTFNILLEELGVRNRVTSIASDMNSDAIGAAKKGYYDLIKLHEYDKNYKEFKGFGGLQTYYTIADNNGAMDLSLIDNVTFLENNLITDTVDEEFDIIFCRNVMIYFDQIAKLKVLDKFYNNLNPNGLLIIGFFDSLVTVIDKTQFQFYELEYKMFKKFGDINVATMDSLTKKKLNLLVHLAKIDGDFHKSEKALINALIISNGLDPEEFKLLSAHSLDDVNDIEDKPEMLYLALRLIMADGRIEPREIDYCEKLASRMGYDPALIKYYAYSRLPSRAEFDQQIKKHLKQVI